MVSTAVALTSGLGSFKSFIRILTANIPTSGLEYFSLQHIKASQALLFTFELWLAQNFTHTGRIVSISIVLSAFRFSSLCGPFTLKECLWFRTGNYCWHGLHDDHDPSFVVETKFDQHILLIVSPSAGGSAGVLRVSSKFIINWLPGLLTHASIISTVLRHFLEEHVKINWNKKEFVGENFDKLIWVKRGCCCDLLCLNPSIGGRSIGVFLSSINLKIFQLCDYLEMELFY